MTPLSTNLRHWKYVIIHLVLVISKPSLHFIFMVCWFECGMSPRLLCRWLVTSYGGWGGGCGTCRGGALLKELCLPLLLGCRQQKHSSHTCPPQLGAQSPQLLPCWAVLCLLRHESEPIFPFFNHFCQVFNQSIQDTWCNIWWPVSKMYYSDMWHTKSLFTQQAFIIWAYHIVWAWCPKQWLYHEALMCILWLLISLPASLHQPAAPLLLVLGPPTSSLPPPTHMYLLTSPIPQPPLIPLPSSFLASWHKPI